MQVKVTRPPARVPHPNTSGTAKGEEAALLRSFVQHGKIAQLNTPGTETGNRTSTFTPDLA